MATNRLFVYDPVTHTATIIAKGFSIGWESTQEFQNGFFDNIDEFTGDLGETGTRLQLKTEDNLPHKCTVYWGNGPKVF